MNKLIIFLIAWNFLIQANEPSMHIKYTDEMTKAFVKEIEQELGLICIGKGGSMPYDVESIRLMFEVHQRATIDEACALEVQIIEKLLHTVNRNEKIRPYLREYPFTASRADISISFNKPNGDPYTEGIVVGYIFQARGYLFYRKVSKEGDLSNLGDEPYDAALKIVQNPHLKIKHDFSKRWSKRKERILELCPEEETKFLKQYFSQTPLQRWERAIEIAENNSRMTLSDAIRELISGITNPYFVNDTIEKIAEMEKTQNSGEYVEYWDNGQIKVKAAFKNGYADGHIHGWYENGCDAFKAYFSEGMKQGSHMAFFPPKRCGGPTENHGRIFSYNEQGKPQGEHSTSYPSGRLESITRYKNGILNGEIKIYADKGKGLIENRKYENGKLIDRKILQPRYLESKSK